MSNKITMPWEERPAGCKDVMWRYSENPVIDRYHIPSSNSIFNSAVVPFKDGYAGVFRCDNRAVQMNIFAGFSKDGIHWEIEHEPIKFKAGYGFRPLIICNFINNVCFEPFTVVGDCRNIGCKLNGSKCVVGLTDCG